LDKYPKKFLIKNDYSNLIDLLRFQKKRDTNITFIGMPGAGKSYLSKYLSENNKLHLIEVD